ARCASTQRSRDLPPLAVVCVSFCCCVPSDFFLFFFFNRTAPPALYTLSLHDALPISVTGQRLGVRVVLRDRLLDEPQHVILLRRSEEHTSELQSLAYLVCRLLLEKKKRSS